VLYFTRLTAVLNASEPTSPRCFLQVKERLAKVQKKHSAAVAKPAEEEEEEAEAEEEVEEVRRAASLSHVPAAQDSV
jgi:predicted CopG family antitoxin